MERLCCVVLQPASSTRPSTGEHVPLLDAEFLQWRVHSGSAALLCVCVCVCDIQRQPAQQVCDLQQGREAVWMVQWTKVGRLINNL